MKTHERFINGCIQLKTFPKLGSIDLPTDILASTKDYHSEPIEHILEKVVEMPNLIEPGSADLHEEDGSELPYLLTPTNFLNSDIFSDQTLASLDTNTPVMLKRSVDMLPPMSVEKNSWLKEQNLWVGVRKCKVDAVDRVRKSYEDTRGWAKPGVKKARFD